MCSLEVPIAILICGDFLLPCEMVVHRCLASDRFKAANIFIKEQGKKRLCCMHRGITALCLHCRALFAVERMSAFHPQVVDTLQSQLVGAFNRWTFLQMPDWVFNLTTPET